MSAPLLQLTNVTRRFPAGENEVVVLKDVSLSIAAGEIVAIVGASGSGKSTLLNILGCLDHPDSGSYRVGGLDTGELAGVELARLRREYFGFVFQRYHLLTHLSAAANVEMPAVYAGSARRTRRERARQLLGRVGLADRFDYRPSQLSGGQQQRVSIARALMNGGQVILADEPTGALDKKSSQEVIRILCELNSLGHTVVIVTHDEQIAAYAHRIVEISDGEIIDDRWNGRGAESAAAPRDVIDAPHAVHWISAGLGHFVEALRTAWDALVAHRLRTMLTILGIVIGIASVVSIVAIGEGAKRYMLEEIKRIGSNTIDIYPGMDWGDGNAADIQTLVPADVTALLEQSYVDSATPVTTRAMLLRYRNVDVVASINGVGEKFFQVNGIEFSAGGAFSREAVQRQAQVVVIDENARKKLFGSLVDPIGQIILVANQPCRVIGVAAEKQGVAGVTRDLNVWLPYSTASARLFGQSFLGSVRVRVREGHSSAAAEQQLTQILALRHGRKDFYTANMDSVVKTVEKTGQSMTLLLSLIAVISLVVGGIGVMNVTLVSVTERTQEIGIRMAVGARPINIMQQFLIEAVMMCLMGGAIGIALSFGVSFLFSMFVDQWKMVFSAASIVSAFLCSTLIGIVFGFVPARNASRLNPIAALARE
jgi:macrolide transport system ATP-binding/permease protein